MITVQGEDFKFRTVPALWKVFVEAKNSRKRPLKLVNLQQIAKACLEARTRSHERPDLRTIHGRMMAARQADVSSSSLLETRGSPHSPLLLTPNTTTSEYDQTSEMGCSSNFRSPPLAEMEEPDSSNKWDAPMKMERQTDGGLDKEDSLVPPVSPDSVSSMPDLGETSDEDQETDETEEWVDEQDVVRSRSELASSSNAEAERDAFGRWKKRERKKELDVTRCMLCRGCRVRVVPNPNGEGQNILECSNASCMASIRYTDLPVGTERGEPPGSKFNYGWYMNDPARVFYPSREALDKAQERHKLPLHVSPYVPEHLEDDVGNLYIRCPGQLSLVKLI